MGAETVANLIVAGSDLKLVRLLRDAIRTADLSSGKGSPIAAIGPAPNPLLGVHGRHRHEPDPVIEPRKRIEPTPRFEPRPVHHPEPRFEPRPVGYVCERCPDATQLPADPVTSKSPIEPPWKVLPWETALPAEAPLPRKVVKWVVRPVDSAAQGADDRPVRLRHVSPGERRQSTDWSGRAMLEAQQVEELICLVAAMDRESVVRHLREYPSTFPIDFTPEFLDAVPLDRLRHIFLALCAQCQHLPAMVEVPTAA